VETHPVEDEERETMVAVNVPRLDIPTTDADEFREPVDLHMRQKGKKVK